MQVIIYLLDAWEHGRLPALKPQATPAGGRPGTEPMRTPVFYLETAADEAITRRTGERIPGNPGTGAGPSPSRHVGRGRRWRLGRLGRRRGGLRRRKRPLGL